MNSSMPSAVNSFSANPSQPGSLSGSFHPARAISPWRGEAVVGRLSLRRDPFLAHHGPNDPILLSRNDAARFGGSWRNWISIGTVVAEQGVAAEQGIDHVTTITDAVFALEELGLQRTAKRVAQLDSLCQEDPDEPDVDLESLKRLVRVMQANPGWGEPSLSLTDEGFAQAEWPLRAGGSVAVFFLPTGWVDYVATAAPTAEGDVPNAGGHLPESSAPLDRIRWFTDQIKQR